MTTVRTLPFRVSPVPGEAIDSWLETIAFRCDTPWADLMSALGDTLPRGGNSTAWVLQLSDAQAAAISTATQIDVTALRSMTLARYPEMAVGIDRQTGSSRLAFPWRHVHASRFCPYCLADNGGRWKLVWRMAWFFACAEHRCLLADVCPRCGSAQRRRHVAALVPQPGRCGSVPTEPVTVIASRCGADVTQAHVTRFDTGHPVLVAQSTITDIIVNDVGDFGIYSNCPQPGRHILTDIRAVGQYFVTAADPAVLNGILPSGLVSEYRELSCHPRTTKRRLLERSSPAVTTAVAVTAALSILGHPDIGAAATVMRSVWPRGRKSPLYTRITNPTSAGGGTSIALRAVHLTALGPQLSATDQLRCRLGTALPRRPAPDMARAARTAKRIPTIFWPEWSLRLAGSRSSQRQLRPVLSVAALLVGADLRVGDAAELLDCPLTAPGVITMLHHLRRTAHWNDIRRALYRLSDHLERCGTPIDYQRRRRLDYCELLPPSHWEAICCNTNTHPAGASIARKYLLERLSGTHAFAAPVPDIDATDYQSLLRFPMRLTPELSSALEAHARDFLAAQGITDEPVKWQPPTSLVCGLRLPSTGTDNLDSTFLHQLIRRDGLLLGAAADRLGTTIDAVRVSLEEHPAPRDPRQPSRPRVTARRMGPAYRQASSVLTRERFIQLYGVERHSLRDIAAMVGVCRPTVAELARDYAIPVRKAGGRRRIIIDRDWLYEEHVAKGRSLSELAQERRMSVSTVAKLAHVYGIPVRGLSRYTATILRENHNVPTILTPALTNQGGWERLQRLAVIAQHTSLTAAARQLNISHCTLGLQIRRIERDLGRPVLIRATDRRPLKLTKFGEQVVAAVHDLASCGGPSSRSTD